jgi:hypothetical protein
MLVINISGDEGEALLLHKDCGMMRGMRDFREKNE